MTATMARPVNYVERVEAIAPLIRDKAAWSQRERRLAPEVVEAFHDAGLFRLLIPARMGGGGLAEPEVIPVVEAVARLDASAAWNLAIGIGSLGFARLLDEAVFAEIVSNPRALAAGTVNPHSIQLRAVDSGYVVSGTGPFGSGCSQATWCAAGGLLMGENGPVTGVDGAPAILVAFIPRDQVEIRDTWDASGLRGTGSHDIYYGDIFVPSGRVFDLRSTQPRPLDPYATIPLQSRLGATLVGIGVGVAAHALEELRDIASTKTAFATTMLVRDRADVQIAVAQAAGLIEAARAVAPAVLADVLPKALGGNPLSVEDLARLRLAYVTATDLCVQAVDRIHAAAGTSALPRDSAIGLCWRDIHAVSQHVAVQTKHQQNIGRVLLGLPPAGPL